MMGRENPPQASLFYTGINLEKRVRSDHVLRKVARLVDFDFIYGEVKESYGYNGNVSVPPPMIVKLMLLLVLYNVRSERELMATLPERLDWLWFLGLELDSEIPDHSVLSKARKRWGVELFRSFFERIVWQCVAGGLVDGEKLFCDSSLIEADASCRSVVDTQGLKRYLNPAYRELEARLEDQEKKENDDNDSILRLGAMWLTSATLPRPTQTLRWHARVKGIPSCTIKLTEALTVPVGSSQQP